MAYTRSQSAVLGYGTVVSIGGVTGVSGTETFTPIGEVISVKIPASKRDVVFTTNFESPSGSKEKLGVAIDFMQATITANRVSSDAGQVALLAANLNNGVHYDFKIQLPINQADGQTTTGDVLTFSAIISECGGFDISLTDVSKIDFTLDISGIITVTPGS